MMGPIKTAAALVAAQAEDPGLWFRAERITEAYLQAALRALHAAVEAEVQRPQLNPMAHRPFPAEPTDEQIEAIFERHGLPLLRVSSERPEDQRPISIMNLMFRQCYLEAARDLVKLGRASA